MDNTESNSLGGEHYLISVEQPPRVDTLKIQLTKEEARVIYYVLEQCAPTITQEENKKVIKPLVRALQVIAFDSTF